ncbi:uncharacterized protein Z519_04734 [Cladophialophora bantiana CBS 173.52]|uniref:U3 small nucleolar RNA-associated protein 14 n=1 Tax=Cladophialophora bantiana (strain ATCC 10958 / CBS 173.52 / CDC B-1940 / NIH 8579) TaxID=1442370 RepID=A0A0D2G7X4_CLAB1|nr:uncharacterized protein Z519_04734 [Cladophialophora bantiana CBS 173.52]KIW94757.1 hypothetical protein Z519_04734 [Cladophialophora bantiana CBS 173.52]
MPRQAHGRPLQTGRLNAGPKKKPARNRRLNALEIAEREHPDEFKIRQHRLGQVDDEFDDSRSRVDVDERSSKRRKLATTAGNEVEEDEEGSDLEGNRWHLGVNEEDEDSDIESEEAFGASDEERFADFTFRGSATTSSEPNHRGGAASLELDDEGKTGEENKNTNDEPDDDFGDEAVDLATAWDMDDQEQVGVSRRRPKNRTHLTNDAGDGDDSSHSELDDDTESDDEISHAEGDAESELSISDDEGDHSRLLNFVEGLANGSKTQTVVERRHLQSLPNKPSQFGLGSTEMPSTDLLRYVKDPHQRQSLKILQNSDGRGHEAYKSGIPGRLAPPLAKRQQDRLDRSAAYEETKKELGKWIETVKQNRRAEHLSFPLVDAAVAGMLSNKQLGPTSTTEPMTSLESAIRNIMMESGMQSRDSRSQEDQERAFEELHEKKMPLAEVQARRAELRRARDLMFREEIRARRIKKIKSKAYRRIHRKERENASQEHRSLLAAQGLIDSEEEREQNERRRAEERMGARHRESKWAKTVKATGRATWDEEARHGVADLARRDEELRRRIDGKASAGSDDSGSESSDFEGFSGTDDERENLETRLDEVERVEVDTFETRLGSMAFMRKAEAARKAVNEEEIRKIRRSLHSDEVESVSQGHLEDAAPMGRQKFGVAGGDIPVKPQVRVSKSEFEEPEPEAELEDIRDQDQREGLKDNAPTATSLEIGIKLDRSSTRSLKRPGAKRTGSSNTNNNLSSQNFLPRLANKEGESLKKTTRVPRSHLDGYTSPSESENEQDERAALAQAIFAGSGEIQREFAREKKETVEEEGDQVVDDGLPGWGSWTGEGISKKAQKRVKGRYLTTVKGVAEEKRQDARLEKVIINEKRVKKNGKYLASELPHPFESRQQYERSLRLPLGPEWTTKTTFQDGTKPRVLIKQGIIRPMARPLA